MNIMTIGGKKAVISYDPDTETFRGEFVGLNGGADFYAVDVSGRHREGELSLKILLEESERRGIDPHKSFSGKLTLRVSPQTHEAAAVAAAAHGVSLNQWAVNVLEQAAAAQ
ncbi:type II toxin-antitoxin system HicB family antitoxin [Burkholderia sp. Ac-20353]|nr:type II toxin-antitoxin system HicB family antitoxin [Burkholderia sp. Ac-20353]